MAKTEVANVIVPEVFNPYVIQRTAELSQFYNSGIISRDPEIDNRVAAVGSGGTKVNMPFWNDLTGDDELLSDQDNDALTPGLIAADKDVAAVLLRGKAWSTNDLAGALAGSDPMKAIGDLVAAYWARRLQVALFATLGGAFAAASASGNVHDITGEAGDAALIGASTFLDAKQKLGDSADKLTAVAMHSATYTYLQKQNLIDFIPDATGAINIPVYLGKRVIVDDGLPVDTGDYTSYLFGAGAIGYGEGTPDVPTETDRDSLAGNNILINRKHFLLHPRGIKWKGTPAKLSASNVELAVGTNWERVYENKNIRIVQFKHKIG